MDPRSRGFGARKGTSTTARPLMGARRLVVSALVVALVGAAGVARARVERQEGGPPWRATGRVGFTLDALVLLGETSESGALREGDERAWESRGECAKQHGIGVDRHGP